MFQIEFVPSALLDLEHLPKAAQQMVVDAIATQLSHEPLKETRNRKPMRENPLATWELRIGKNRVFYDVELTQPEASIPGEGVVTICAVGFKEHNKLFIRGQEFKL